MKLSAITTREPVDSPARANDLLSHFKADKTDIDLDPRTGLIALTDRESDGVTIVHVSNMRYAHPFIEKPEPKTEPKAA